ncbi:hydantoinase/oxoprolinase family protein [Desulforamulus hydrothermalis]|uniref:Hydantoinase/oxoprolinase n=1 Tax=Desulforamulus hydrothermalis Lam5 = DSM 18033 TaxID=1121428 RepID=K8E141_9FIRM|nr:hydantoinase/oxoprolinase family protein [Desulforamulus hydrothermalis]CCO09350.1 Hydantoinase/oxoprolinase [Desulforamulus hydrothermalis Lam5 = DSM 18033]SHH32456.1 N-methylhydantoinase A/oxoprolinase/acetone carboxylase, beta subunit [Desulforamulus hydrothermalis Lam5 = DSM 18033]
MLIGIDVGGTCTDAVLLDGGAVRATAKVETQDDLLLSLGDALDNLLKGIPGKQIQRVVFSTTIVTNLIAEKKYDPVGLLLLPGPGRTLMEFRQQEDVFFLTGAIDYRGREIIPLAEDELVRAVGWLEEKGYQRVAVVGKFSTRNNAHELRVAEYIKQQHPDWQVEMGHRAGGRLNFPRRIVNTLLTCATRDKYRYFANAVRDAMARRDIGADVFILKADGGTLPLVFSEQVPVETIFSGPAASTLGVQALTPPGETSLVVDIGGTTTDLALILSGQPLLASRGAKIGDRYTQVRALSVRSVPVGGDSVVERVGKELIIYSERVGQAYCLGGPLPTPTDALRYMGMTQIGDADRAREAMQSLGDPMGMGPMEVAHNIVNLVIDTIVSEIQQMFVEWEQEPAYRVWEVMQKKKLRPQNVVGVGGGAAGFVPQIAARLGCTPILPPYAPVANAIGAAVARPTLQVSLLADTERQIFIVEEEGYQGRLSGRLDEIGAVELAKSWLMKRAANMNLLEYVEEIEITNRDVFNIVRDWRTTGRLYHISVQTPRGILGHIGSGGRLIK